MPNLDRLTPWIEEDEDYVDALNASPFSRMTIDTLYLVRILDSIFESLEDFVEWMADKIADLGAPFELDVEEMMPDEAFFVGLRTGKDTDLFGTPWIANGIPGEPGGDIYSPDDPNGNYYQPDGIVDGFDWINSANKFMVFTATMVALRLFGKDILRFVSSSGKWMASTITNVLPAMRYHTMSKQLDEIEGDISKLLTEDDGISRFMDDSTTPTAEYGQAILVALKLLGEALDTNDQTSYLKYQKHLREVDT